MLGTGSEPSTAFIQGCEGKLPNPAGVNLAVGHNSIHWSKTMGNFTPCWFLRGWPLSSNIHSPPLSKVLQSKLKGCVPILPAILLGLFVQGRIASSFTYSPATKTLYPAGKLPLMCILLFDLMQDQDPFFIPGQFCSLSPVPHLFPSPVSFTPGCS